MSSVAETQATQSPDRSWLATLLAKRELLLGIVIVVTCIVLDRKSVV